MLNRAAAPLSLPFFTAARLANGAAGAQRFAPAGRGVDSSTAKASSTMRGPVALLLFAACATPLAADTVHLVNGNKFEEVVARRAADEVRIGLPHGEIVLPAKVVARIERSPSTWRAFGERAAALDGASSSAADWLDLARWAELAGYAAGMRQALLRAAELDAGLAGLAPRMSGLGYLLDAESGRWLAEADYMRRRGYRLWQGYWLPRDEYAARLRVRQEEAARRREEARQERITRAIEALVVAQLSRAAEPEPAAPPAATSGPVVAVFPGYFSFGSAAAAAGQPPSAAAGGVYDELARRQPGSLLPVPQPRRPTSGE